MSKICGHLRSMIKLYAAVYLLVCVLGSYSVCMFGSYTFEFYIVGSGLKCSCNSILAFC